MNNLSKFFCTVGLPLGLLVMGFLRLMAIKLTSGFSGLGQIIGIFYVCGIITTVAVVGFIGFLLLW